MLNPYLIILIMAAAGFVLGLITFIVGIVILLFRPSNSDVKALIAQSTALAQKGIAEDVAGLVGHVSTLLESLNQLVKTTSGVGILLVILGVLLMAGSSWLALQVSKVSGLTLE
ncbi:MAG TPA: hypothetical protein VN363_08470 [Anaerolineales bacterium]|nr:hypothetical protein [Anaerolineales bacterium]